MGERTRFQLAGSDGRVGLRGPLICYSNLEEAEIAVHTGEYGDLVAGAIPFDPRSANASLYLGWRDAPERTVPASAPGGVRPDIEFNDAAIAAYLRLLDHAVPLLRAPDSGVDKIVVSRAERFRYEGTTDPAQLFERIVTLYPRARNYHVEHLDSPGVHTMGASPELFLRKSGATVALTPLAGTVARDPRVAESQDRARARAELFTPEYLTAHRRLLGFLVSALAPLCSRVEHPPEPELIAAADLWHLGTPVTGTLLDTELPVSELVRTLHPSPAVCGSPQPAALRLIRDHESPRDYHGGLVGWLDAAGDCEFHLALRGMQLDTHRGHITLRAGGGLLPESRANLEFARTATKLATMRRVLGPVR
ncbi:chorismate-binding protein [Nocardia sp. NPDC055321]